MTKIPPDAVTNLHKLHGDVAVAEAEVQMHVAQAQTAQGQLALAQAVFSREVRRLLRDSGAPPESEIDWETGEIRKCTPPPAPPASPPSPVPPA